MKKPALLIVIMLLSIPTVVLASSNTSVDISGNDPGSQNSVTIINDQNTGNVNGYSSQTGSTDVRIESNGEVKEYHSSGNENVNVQSSDGKSKVSIQNQTSAPKPEQKSSVNQNSSHFSTSIKSNVNGAKTEVRSDTNATSSAIPTTPPIPSKPVQIQSQQEKNAILQWIDAQMAFLNQLKNMFFQNLFH